MTVTLILSVLTFLTLAASILFFPTLRIGRFRTGTYWLIALGGALLLLLTGQVPAEELWSRLTAGSAIDPVRILALFFSMTFLSVYLDEVGLFRWLAKIAVRFAGRDQRRLFVTFYLLAAVLTVFTSNDVVILALTPFLCFFCRNTEIDPLPYLIGEFAAANTWSMMLVIGNPTNVYLASSAGIGFLDYLRVMALPTLAAGTLEFVLIYFLFRRRLEQPVRPHVDNYRVKSRLHLAVGAAHLAVCLTLLVVSGYVGLEMWLVSAACALCLLLFAAIAALIHNRDRRILLRALRRLPWTLIPFVLSMFVVVAALEQQGIARLLGDALGEKGALWTYGGASLLFANLINNIPMSMLFSTLPSAASPSYLQAVYAAVVGSNLGAFLTPIGALAGIMFTELTEKYQVKFGFRQFVRYGALISLPTAAAALSVLALIFA